MGFLDWWRSRATTDPTDTGTAESIVPLLAPPAAEPAEGELDELRRAAAAHEELRSVYVFRDMRLDPEVLVVGVLLEEAVSDERLQEVSGDLAGRVRAGDWGAARVVVEPLGPDRLQEADELVGPLYEREPPGL
jgi:hypothetical protein